MATLQPLWATLPSPEARATRPFRAGSGRTLPCMRSGCTRQSRPVVSIRDMEVRTLKSLYSTNTNGATHSVPVSPRFSLADGTPATFHVEVFALRLQAHIGDNYALDERYIRFAQTPDLLKKSVERAQKLAQDNIAALETHQRQMRTEEQLTRSDSLERLPFAFFFPCIEVRLDRNSLIGLRSRSARLKRQSRSASSQRRTRRRPRARCSLRRTRRQRKRRKLNTALQRLL